MAGIETRSIPEQIPQEENLQLYIFLVNPSEIRSQIEISCLDWANTPCLGTETIPGCGKPQIPVLLDASFPIEFRERLDEDFAAEVPSVVGVSCDCDKQHESLEDDKPKGHLRPEDINTLATAFNSQLAKLEATVKVDELKTLFRRPIYDHDIAELRRQSEFNKYLATIQK